MPELPEIEALASFLRSRAVGRVVARVDPVAVSAFKTYDPPATALAGLEVTGASRHGKFLDVDVSGLHLVVHLARAGWLQWRDQLPSAPPRMGKGPIALRVHLDDGSGFDLTEAGTKKGLAVYVTPDVSTVPGVARLGVDPLSPEFTEELLAGLLTGQRGQVKGLLTDQSVIAGVGNAYSDEVLWEVGLSPFKPAKNLTADEAHRLHAAVVRTLRAAVDRAEGARARLLAGTRCGRCPSPTRRCSTARPVRRTASRSPTVGCPGCSSSTGRSGGRTVG